MDPLEFPFSFHPAFRLPALVFGVTDRTAGVTVEQNRLTARFGPWALTTSLSNIASVRVTGGFAWPKVIGPAHLSLADGGLTFATNPHRAVCITLHHPVRGLDPLGLVRHRSLTVTVADTAALAELLDRRSHDQARVHADPQMATADELVEEAREELRSLTASELRARAKDRGVSGVSRLTKAELLERLLPEQVAP